MSQNRRVFRYRVVFDDHNVSTYSRSVRSSLTELGWDALMLRGLLCYPGASTPGLPANGVRIIGRCHCRFP